MHSEQIFFALDNPLNTHISTILLQLMGVMDSGGQGKLEKDMNQATGIRTVSCCCWNSDQNHGLKQQVYHLTVLEIGHLKGQYGAKSRCLGASILPGGWL